MPSQQLKNPSCLLCCCSRHRTRSPHTWGWLTREIASAFSLTILHAQQISSSAGAWKGCATEHRSAREVMSLGATLSKWEGNRGPSRNSMVPLGISGDAVLGWEGRCVYCEAVASWLTHHIIFAPPCFSNFSVHFSWDCIPPIKHYDESFGFRACVFREPSLSQSFMPFFCSLSSKQQQG